MAWSKACAREHRAVTVGQCCVTAAAAAMRLFRSLLLTRSAKGNCCSRSSMSARHSKSTKSAWPAGNLAAACQAPVFMAGMHTTVFAPSVAGLSQDSSTENKASVGAGTGGQLIWHGKVHHPRAAASAAVVGPRSLYVKVATSASSCNTTPSKNDNVGSDSSAPPIGWH